MAESRDNHLSSPAAAQKAGAWPSSPHSRPAAVLLANHHIHHQSPRNGIAASAVGSDTSVGSGSSSRSAHRVETEGGHGTSQTASS